MNLQFDCQKSGNRREFTRMGLKTDKRIAKCKTKFANHPPGIA